jgi:hypothetical protein
VGAATLEEERYARRLLMAQRIADPVRTRAGGGGLGAACWARRVGRGCTYARATAASTASWLADSCCCCCCVQEWRPWREPSAAEERALEEAMAAAKVQAMQRGRLGRRRATEVSEEKGR